MEDTGVPEKTSDLLEVTDKPRLSKFIPIENSDTEKLYLCFDLRDRPFNLKGGGGGVMVFCFVQNYFFSDNTRVRIFFYLSRKARNFFPEINIRLYDKNSKSDNFVFPPPKSEYFFQQHLESEYLFRKKT